MSIIINIVGFILSCNGISICKRILAPLHFGGDSNKAHVNIHF